MHHNLGTALKSSLIWLLSAAILTIIFGTIYVTVQQIYRQSANDPQIELTQEVVKTLEQGAPVDAFLPPPNLDCQHYYQPACTSGITMVLAEGDIS